MTTKVKSKTQVNKNSMTYWLPIAEQFEMEIPMPMNIIVDKIDKELFEFIMYNKPLSKTTLARIKVAITTLGGYPVFMRSDYGSAKHDYENTCYVPNEKSLLQHIHNLLEWHHLVNVSYNALVFRQFIELESTFTAFKGLPVNKERRYFIRNGNLQCHHKYWPEDAIWIHSVANIPDWKKRLARLNEEDEDEIRLLTGYAELLGSKLKGYWSVDFAKARNGQFYFIDAALGDVSWHDEKCMYAK